ncbi:SCO family protein [Streptomyces fildesensis]|uniref:SCO family protein n=1 Tax=Streptomyces fildesensis TaxID=375757 RepID=A0ABW8CBQ7_9ACTN
MRTTIKIGVALAAVAALAGCGSSSGDSKEPLAVVSGAASKPGTLLDDPFSKPRLTLTDTHGKPYDLVKETAGRPVLLFFGYTHCPDVCPTTMSDLAIAKSRLSKPDQEKLRVVFVSTDPARDTPQRLGSWLAAQDKDFIGLTGDFGTIQKAAKSVGVGIEKPVTEKDGSITVTHGAEVLAFWPKDDKGHVLYMSGTTSDEFAADLPKLIRSEAP